MSTATVPSRPSAARPTGARPAASRTGGTRLTRRGRFVVTLLVLVALAGLLVAGAASVSARSAQAAGAGTVEVVVQPGQTLWGLAEQVAPGADPREVVHRIQQLNDLPDSSVSPGQPLLVPAA